MNMIFQQIWAILSYKLTVLLISPLAQSEGIRNHFEGILKEMGKVKK